MQSKCQTVISNELNFYVFLGQILFVREQVD